MTQPWTRLIGREAQLLLQLVQDAAPARVQQEVVKRVCHAPARTCGRVEELRNLRAAQSPA